ncbi:unnamed protein product [Timema podura]|uniref:Conserved oligomeric Golgi complex subunit 1 n=1 Tax=Timema podura TaxID=61482 RepID=A0ABN7PCL4_TIMPD|nr:unnamed protein product [Timema podura]
MPEQNLLDTNVDKLFESLSIGKINDVRKKIQSEVERKKQELRIIVGERYRDLIEAADTISDMKKTAEGVISHIEEMSVKCQQLQLRQLYGFKADLAHIKSSR